MDSSDSYFAHGKDKGEIEEEKVKWLLSMSTMGHEKTN
jgi:hypothetical protein